MGMKAYHGHVKSIDDTPFGFTIKLIGGKWKMVILYLISENQPVRFNEIHKYIGTISFKTLSEQLKELEQNDLIIRTEFPDPPLRVEYKLSEKGESLIPCLEALCYWGVDHQK